MSNRNAAKTVSQVSAILFDLDGVVLDSRKTILQSLRKAVDDHRIPGVTDAELARLIGPPMVSVARSLARKSTEQSVRLAEDIANSYRAHYREVCFAQTPLFPGVASMLRALSRRYPLAVASSKPTAFSRPLLQNHGLLALFETVCGPSLDLQTAEPKMETVARALDELGLGNRPETPPRAVIIGDREHDVIAGKDNGLYTIAVTWGFGDQEELKAARPDIMVDSVEEVLKLFDR